MTLRVLIADDEPLARQRLEGLLDREPDLRRVASCCDGAEALARARAEAPDLVFLDVHMPELSGVEVARRLAGPGGPAVVFVTAYDRHAIEAFELNALDYLLKPFDRERFSRCLERVRQRLRAAPDPDLARRLRDLLGAPARRVELRDGARSVFLSADEIDWIESAGNYVIVHAAGSTFIERSTMGEMAARLADAGFLRCHRSAIVNTRRVRALSTPSTGELHLVTCGGEQVPVSRRHLDALREAMARGE